MDYRIKTAGGIVDFSLVRKNVKNLRLRVTDEAKVVVSAPRHTKQSTIMKFVQDNADFVAERIEKVEYDRLSSYPSEYRTGDMFSYLGRRTLMRVQKYEKHGAKLSGGILTLRVSDPSDAHMCKQSFIKWSKKQAKIVFSERLAQIIPHFENLAEVGVRISVRDMKTRWGSINVRKHTMSLSVHLLRCEVELIDHIIKHELCHYAYQNHSKAFYDELNIHSPNTNAMRKRLKEYGLVGY